MTAAPATENGADESGGKRRIGDILLELGFVNDEALAKAADEQKRTGQPLGQILVEHGAITRLELASALAEQWADQVSITTLPIPTALPRVVPQQVVHHDEDQYAARLQEAVADLTQRVRLPDNENPLDGRLIELAERVESTVARTQRLEATASALVESLEGVTSGVEEAFGVLQAGMSGLAMDLARIETSVTEMSSHPAEAAADPALAAKIDELWRFVHELADRPHVDDDARGRAEELAGQLEALADLDDLRSAVAELAARPAGSPEVDAQLERLEARLNDQATTVADSSAVESLAGRLDAALATQGTLEAALAAIDDRLRLLAREIASRADASVADDVASIKGRLTDLVSGEELSLALERTRDELASVPPEPDPRIDDLARDLVAVRDELHEATGARLEAVEARLEAELASSTDPEAAKAMAALSERIEELSRERYHQEELVAKLDALEHRIPTDTVRTGDLEAALERARLELAPRPHEPDPRIDHLARELASIREELDQEELAARLDALDGRLSGAVSREELASALERTRAALAPQEPDPRIEATAARLEAVEARLQAELATSTDPEAAKALAALSERIEELSRDRRHQDELAAKLDALESRIPADAVTAAELDAAVTELRETQPPAPEVDTELAGAVEALAGRLTDLEELRARVDGHAEQLAAAPESPAGVDEELRRELDERVAELARTVDERLAATPEGAASGGEGLEEDIERFRMTLERLSLHLAEHDRTLSEMRSARDVTQRLDELADQVAALAAGGVASSNGEDGRRGGAGFSRDLEPNEMRQLIRRIEDCEEAAHEGKEKLMNRLERMASSIDWRLQRLESAGDEASPAED